MQQKRSKKGMLIILAAVLLLAGGTAVFFYLKIANSVFTEEGHPAADVPAYQETFFDTEETAVIRIEITDEAWTQITRDAAAGTFVPCDVTINGETMENVGISAAGKNSLFTLNQSQSDRQSFDLDFACYEDGQTYEGLDGLTLSNGIYDPTYMREAISYDLFTYMGVPCALQTYAKVIVNGQYLGLYLAVEDMGDSFLQREYGADAGTICLPDGQGTAAAGMAQEADSSADGSASGQDRSYLYLGWSEERFLEEQQSARDYSDVTDAMQSAMATVGTAQTGFTARMENVDDADVDQILRYLAVQTFVAGLGDMNASSGRNFCLYVQEGRTSVLPLDFSQAFGGYGLEDADAFLNYPVDSPYAMGNETDAAFFGQFLANQRYRQRYEKYLKQICAEYVDGGKLDAEYAALRAEMDDALKEDPTAFYPYESYDTYATDLLTLIRKRSESVSGQLAGSGETACADGLHFYSMRDMLTDKTAISLSSVFDGNTRLGHVMVCLKDMTYADYRAWTATYVYSYVQVPEGYYADEVWTGDWSQIEAGGQKLYVFGCGLCCLTNVYDTLVAGPDKKAVITPDVMYTWAKERASYKPESGTGALSWQQIKKMCQSFGLSATACRKPEDYSAFRQAVAEDDATIALVCKDNDDKLWPNTKGHYITLWDYDADTDTVLVTDSSGLHNRERIALLDIYRALKTSSGSQYLCVYEGF